MTCQELLSNFQLTLSSPTVATTRLIENLQHCTHVGVIVVQDNVIRKERHHCRQSV